jgi:hypothetical protein
MEFRDDGLDARDDALCPRLPLVAVTNTTERDRLSADEDPEGHSAVGIPLLGQRDPVALSRVETFNDVGREMTGLLRRLLVKNEKEVEQLCRERRKAGEQETDGDPSKGARYLSS